MAEDGAGDSADISELSWEELEDTGELDKKFSEMAVVQNNPKLVSEAVVIQDGSDRTQYQPQVRILKRQNDQQNSSTSQDPRMNKPTKTLEQREAEYAEARRRILGPSYTVEDQNANNNASPSYSQENKPPRLLQASEAAKLNKSNNCNVEVLRQPRGPDSSDGFDPYR